MQDRAVLENLEELRSSEESCLAAVVGRRHEVDAIVVVRGDISKEYVEIDKGEENPVRNPMERPRKGVLYIKVSEILLLNIIDQYASRFPA